MSDKPGTGFPAYRIIAPLMLVCCALPIIGISGFVAFSSWLGGIDLVNASLFATFTTFTVLAIIRWKRGRSDQQPKTARDTL